LGREASVTADYRERLFARYDSTHATYLDPDDASKVRWFTEYARENYLSHLKGFDKGAAEVLEIGCNKGHLLAALESLGWNRLHGVDLSPECTEKARMLVPKAGISCADATGFLERNRGRFDVILLKAVLEHMPKEEVLPFLERIRGGLREGGVAIVDVPNMDWLFAPHERYMDFTHEVGFTIESLRQVLNVVFAEVRVEAVDVIPHLPFLAEIRKRVARFILGALLRWADPQAGCGSLWKRALLGIAKG
jgi:2-polyprenyl-3-methyl-5-hydroxy-6-metoxy-1,4-benzoquinol methylase